MPTPTFQPPQGQQSTAQLQDWIIKLVRDLNYLLENLDTVNINRLDAKVIIADTVTADKMNVTQLSAIAADLGTITAGIIYGAYIATSNGTYPRIELSSTGNLLNAFKTATNRLYIDPGLSGPTLVFDDGTTIAKLFNLTAFGSTFGITSNHDILLQASGNVGAQSSAGTITDLVAAINSLNSSISSLNSSVSSLSTNKADHGSTGSTTVSDNHNHGIADGTVLSTPTGTVTWVAYAGSGAHSHTI